MTASAEEGPGPVYSAARARLGLIALLFALAGLAWWFTVDRMRGMDNGPGTDLGTLGWFLGIWLVMMAAMMFPSVSPTVALYSQMTKKRSPVAPLVFVCGYLLTWTAAGLLAFGISELVGRLLGEALVWETRTVVPVVRANQCAAERSPAVAHTRVSATRRAFSS